MQQLPVTYFQSADDAFAFKVRGRGQAHVLMSHEQLSSQSRQGSAGSSMVLEKALFYQCVERQSFAISQAAKKSRVCGCLPVCDSFLFNCSLS
jgi:hypothetical protein